MLKKISCGIIVLAAILVGGFYWYTNDYYRAQEDVVSVMKNETLYELSETKQYTKVNRKDSESTKGLIFYPGGKVEESAYLPLIEKLASYDFVCYLVKSPYYLAILDTKAANRIIEEETNIDDWTIVGHSLGGTAASMVVADLPEVTHLVFLGSYSNEDLSELDLAVMSIVGSEDAVVNRDKLESGKALLPKNTKVQVIQGGNHAYYGNYGEQEGDGIATITPFEQQQIVADIIGEWVK